MRVLQCPFNIAGQAWQYAQGLRDLGHEAEVWTFANHPFGFESDRCLDAASKGPLIRALWRRLRATVAAREFDVIHYHFGRTLLPGFLDAIWLDHRGVRTLVSFWGSDARLRTEFVQRQPHARELAQHLPHERRTLARLRRTSRAIRTALVADAELESYVRKTFSDVRFMPQAITPPRGLASPRHGRPLVVHAPSRRYYKGTEHVIRAVNELQCEYDFRFELIENASHDAVQSKMRKASIYIDQLLVGSYGIAAIEAMSHGAAVITNLHPEVRNAYPADPPLVSATPAEIKVVLSQLLDDPERVCGLGDLGRTFARVNHSRSHVAALLEQVYWS